MFQARLFHTCLKFAVDIRCILIAWKFGIFKSYSRNIRSTECAEETLLIRNRSPSFDSSGKAKCIQVSSGILYWRFGNGIISEPLYVSSVSECFTNTSVLMDFTISVTKRKKRKIKYNKGLSSWP